MRAFIIALLCTTPAMAADMPASLNDLLPFPARPETSAGAPARARLLPLVQAEAQRQGVPPALADAVAMVETGYTENAIGSSGEIGLMQIMPATAAMLGFAGSSTDLFKPEVNIHFGVAYLARAWAASGGNLCRALMKYRAGVGQEGYSPLSIQYCQRAGAFLSAQNSPLAAGVGLTTPVQPTLSDPHVIHVGGAGFEGHGPYHPDMAALAAIADIPGLVIERSPAVYWRSAHPGHTAPSMPGAAPGSRAAAAMAAIADTISDPHVIHMPPAD